MAKNWKHTKKLLEDLVCDKLKGRITYQLHCYRPDDNWTGRLEILLDKEAIFTASNCPPADPDFSFMLSSEKIQHMMRKYLKNDPLSEPLKLNRTSLITASSYIADYIYGLSREEHGRIFLEDVMSMLGDYLSSDIEVSLKSASPFINALAVLDRRVGKRRLLKIAEQDSSFAPKWAWPFYQARFEVEGIVSPSWLKNPFY